MLYQTFSHIKGVTPATEQLLWNNAFYNWELFLANAPTIFSQKTYEKYAEFIKLSQQNILHSPHFFAKSLATKFHWRIFPHFRSSLAYLDIETDGQNTITTIAIYDGKNIFHFVNGINLHCFPDAIANYQIIVTFNGKCFDAPMIEKFFHIKLQQVHIDLRYIMKDIGLSGGLKAIEKKLGINRDSLADIDGFFAILLWRDYRYFLNQDALKTLLAYNIEDVLNLETLLIYAYNYHVKNIFPHLLIEMPIQPKNPFSPDLKTIEKMQKKISLMEDRW